MESETEQLAHNCPGRSESRERIVSYIIGASPQERKPGMQAAIDPEVVVAVFVCEAAIACVWPVCIARIQPTHRQVTGLLGRLRGKVYCAVTSPEDRLAQKRQRHGWLKYLPCRLHVIEDETLRRIFS